MVQFAATKIEVPIVRPKITAALIESLVTEELIDYLAVRDYVVLPKGRPLVMIPENRSRGTREAIVNHALKDYHESYLIASEIEKEEVQVKLGEILTKTRKISKIPPPDLSMTEFTYRPTDIDLILEAFGVNKEKHTIDDPFLLAQESLNVFSGNIQPA
ncbi:BA75_01330T0 [Komagataella pastoris]|uniref:BA75_01330T0 n=1 Tax=Komagataella pastoris TaxID=4922 RepID=A0A1B2J9K3_PICPA|nr:BA75_01330T0 [Komagataella pastoris]